MSSGVNDKGMKCPVCNRPVTVELLRNRGPFPFCSERCKMVDLGKWLESDYSIAAEDQSVNDSQDEI